MESEERKKIWIWYLNVDCLILKLYSLRDFLWFKQGHIKMKLPKGFEQKKVLKS